MANDMARKGAPKRLDPPKSHDGMSPRSATMGGIHDNVSPELGADGANYTKLPKLYGPNPISWNNRSRVDDALGGSEPGDNIKTSKMTDHASAINQLGKAIYAEACAAGDDLSRITNAANQLPPKTSEN